MKPLLDGALAPTARQNIARTLSLLFVGAAMAACSPPVMNPDVRDVQLPPGDTSLDIVDTGPPPMDVQPDRPTMDCPPGQIRCSGVCVDTSSDAANCGMCGNSCAALPGVGTSARCVSGMCNITGACQADRADCDRMVANGCEVQLNSAMNCGACGVTCSEPNPMCTMIGASFQCSNSCTGGTPNRCGMTCVNISTDIANCGVCGRNCPAPMNGSATCSAGACGTRCNPGFHACGDQCVSDSSPLSCGSRCTPCPAPLNATATCDGASCGFRCNTGFHQCGDQCVPDNSINSCGTSCSPCAARGNATTTCDGRACGFTCTSGFADCNSDATDGCEAALNTAGACGRCGNVCGGATPFCVPQTGGTFACLSACSGTGVRMCGPFCINTLTDANNCGACDNRCPTVANGTPVCTSGTCEFTCNPGFHRCGNACVSDTDVATCGSSCSPCPGTANGTATCESGACGIRCDLGFSLCGGMCRATGDTTACGPACTPCSTVPNGRAICERDTCAIACQTGYHQCTDPGTGGVACRNDRSPETCGTRCEPCRVPANGTAICNAGTCDFVCNSGFSRCGTICVPTPGAAEPAYCDDGNNDSGDGCGNTCRTESGWYCSGPLPGGQICSTRCGDGLAVPGREACDFDVRTGLPAAPAMVTPVGGDGCEADCRSVTSLYSCSGFAPTPNVCEPNCGNGRLDMGETCDDGNSNVFDGCASCQILTGWSCTNPLNSSTCTTTCGDGLVAVNSAERCDDGWRSVSGATGAGGDGCSATCTIETNFTCSGSPSRCAVTASETYATPIYFRDPTPTGGFVATATTPTGVSCAVDTLQSVTLTFNHSWAGDVSMSIRAPGGASVTLFDRPGVPPLTFGNSSDFGALSILCPTLPSVPTAAERGTPGVYTFTDSASAPMPESGSYTSGSTYQATNASGGFTAISTALAGSTGNGTWQFIYNDLGPGDCGNIFASSVTFTCRPN